MHGAPGQICKSSHGYYFTEGKKTPKTPNYDVFLVLLCLQL